MCYELEKVAVSAFLQLGDKRPAPANPARAAS
jgi:hypothetical protein